MGTSVANRVISYPQAKLNEYQHEVMMNQFKQHLVDLEEDKLSHYSTFSDHSADSSKSLAAAMAASSAAGTDLNLSLIHI